MDESLSSVQPMTPAEPLEIVAARGPLSGCHVLVIDDDEAARQVLRLVLEDEGATVAAVGSGPDGLAEIDRQPPDVLLVDIGMPAVNGFDFVEQVRKMPNSSSRIPAAALTGYISSHDRARAAQVGFQDYLVKPVDPTDLVRTIKTLVAIRPT